MTSTDALFWYAESALPTLRPIIGGLFVLDRAPDWGRAEGAWDAAFALLPRLRERVVEVPLHLGLPEWVEDSHFDRSYHLRRLALPEPGRLRQLLDLVATLLATPLDHERPLWEAYWIDRLEGGRAALFLKLHHCLVDGVGAVAILNALTQRHRDAEPPRLPFDPQAGSPSPSGALERLAGLALDNGRQSVRLAWRAALAPARALRHPAASAERAWRTARGIGGVVAELAAARVSDPLARSGAGLSRRLDVVRIPFERLVRIKAALGVTLNDVVLTTLAATLDAYHRERGVRIPRLNCMVPMNLRSQSERDPLGNRVGTFHIALPLHERSFEQRLRRVTEQTRAAKQDRRGAALPFLAQPLALLPGLAFRWMARGALSRVNLVCTNVPGPGERRYLAGAGVEALYPFVSVVEGMPLAVALLSYAGSVEVGIDTDPEAIPDPHRVASLFEQSLGALEQRSARRSARSARRVAPRGGVRPARRA